MEPFDEGWYLAHYADVRAAVAAGQWPSGYVHFDTVGRSEGRLPVDPQLSGRIDEANRGLVRTQFCFDQFLITTDGACLLIGWIDSRSDRLTRLSAVSFRGDTIDLQPRLSRYRRDDVSKAKSVPAGIYDFGIWVGFDGLADAMRGVSVEIEFASGRATAERLHPQIVAPADLLRILLEAVTWPYTPSCTPSRPDVSIGPMLRQLNRQVLSWAAVGPVLRYGGVTAAPLSIVVAPAPAVDALRRQLDFIAAAPGIDRVELIYVNNDGDATNDFFEFVEFANELYHANVVAIMYSEDAGLARTYNDAARAATGQTLLFLDAAAFPGDRGWLERALRAAAAMTERELVGGILLREDDTVGHGARSFRKRRSPGALWEVADRADGSPLSLADPVPAAAVGGSAMLIPRAFFTGLGGFHEDYIIGGYEDFDLCFRARAAGGSVRLDPSLIFYDLSSEIAPAVSRWSGAMRINQALFNERWSSELARLDPVAPDVAITEPVAATPRRRRRQGL